MAGDDDERGSQPDPWDEIVADALGDEPAGEEISFRFEETVTDASAQGGVEPSAPAPDAPEDAAIEEWMSAAADGEDDAVPPLTVFTPEESVSGSSTIAIGTGMSGVGPSGTLDDDQIAGRAMVGGSSLVGDDPLPGGVLPDSIDGGGDEEKIEWSPGDEASAFGADEQPDDDLGTWDATADVSGGVAATGASAKPVVRRRAKPAKKASPIGQLIGVVMGGVLAIPITLAILIYGLGKDPFGVTKKVPGEVAFLLPAKFRPGYKKPVSAAGGGAGASALDDLPVVPEPAEPMEPVVPAVEPPAAEPADVADVAPDMPPEPAPVTDVAAVDVPSLDDLAGPPAAVAAPEPPPLDTAALDEAVVEANALGEALGAVDDPQNGAYKKLRTRWYRTLARVAEELVAVENAAATSGRPLAGAPDNVAALHGGIGGRESLAAELAALAPDWLAYAKRGSDGVVLPVTFESARRVGPYWTMRASLTGSDGQPKDLTVIARNEPVANAGDRLVVTGVVLDGTVIWAADIRGGAAPPPGF